MKKRNEEWGISQNNWFFEDLVIGTKLQSLLGRTITETDIVNFAGLSGDFSPIYIDHEYARSTPAGGIVANDLMLFSMISSIDTLGFNARLNKSILATKSIKNWHIYSRAKVGDTIHVISELTQKIDNKPARGVVVIHISIVNQRDEIVQEGEYQLVVAKRCYFSN